MVFQFTLLHLTLGGIERSNQDHSVSLVLYRQLDSGAVRPEASCFAYRLSFFIVRLKVFFIEDHI